jgi:hypothetical protein
LFLFAAEWAERRCLDSGVWEGPPPSDASDAAAAAVALQNDADDMQQQGWTNYSQCFLPEIRDLMKRLDSGSGQDAEVIHLRTYLDCMTKGWPKSLEFLGGLSE